MATGISGNQSNNSASSAGAVYVFTRNGTTWSQQAYIKASNTNAGDQFGHSIALSADGSTLAVGANGEDSAATGIGGNQSNNSASDAGAVYVFTRNGTAWSQQAYIKASNANANDSFGYSIALSADGSILAVGAIGESSAATGIGGHQSDNSAPDTGAVYVFTRSGTMWSQQAYVKAPNIVVGFQFGLNIALSADGSTLAVCTNEEGFLIAAAGIGLEPAPLYVGAVYVFTRSGTMWSQQAYVHTSQINFSVALSEDGATLAVGAKEASTAGAVYVFTRNDTTWSQQAQFNASNTSAGDRFGSSVALSADGSTLAVGACGEDSAATGIGGDQFYDTASEAGAVYVFTWRGTTWTQQAYVKASNTGAHDQFGSGVTLSANGATLAVGAFGEASAATGIGGYEANDFAASAGAVYVFRPNAWLP